jgi:signal transduction histidine kinase
MNWASGLLLLVAMSVALTAGYAIGTLRGRARLMRVSDSIGEMARGNLAHRAILPGGDEAARVAEGLNALADSIQMEREATAARDAAQRRLLANISHDLRTPIASIAGYTDALQRGLGDEPERFLAVIAAKAEDLAQLTDDLFYAARIDAGDLELKRGPVDLAEAVRRSVLGFEPQLTGAGALVDVRVPEGRCLVAADPSALARILSNLVANSVRHGGGATTLAVQMAESDGDRIVTISNDGPPLPPDTEHLFARGVTGPSGGTGLGLAIARELAERMGGSVSAGNSAEGLATFTLVMPCGEFSES